MDHSGEGPSYCFVVCSIEKTRDKGKQRSKGSGLGHDSEEPVVLLFLFFLYFFSLQLRTGDQAQLWGTSNTQSLLGKFSSHKNTSKPFLWCCIQPHRLCGGRVEH